MIDRWTAGLVTLMVACGGDDSTTSQPPADGGADQAAADSGGGQDAGDASKATVPGAPTGVMAAANEAKGATVSWTAPAKDGGSPILNYTITASPDGVKVTTPDAKTLASIVLGLKIGSQETFTVHATNAVGDGPESAPSTVATIVDGLAVKGLVACWGDTKLSLTAPAVANAKSYNLYWSTTPGVTRANGTKIPNVTLPYLHMGLVNGTALHYVLTAVDASQVESSESNEATGLPDSTIHDMLAFQSYSFKSIDIADCLSRYSDGATATTRTLTGGNTKLGTTYYGEVAIDPKNKRLYVNGTTGVLVWNNADTVTGNVAPDRQLVTGTVAGIAIDVTHDVLYASTGSTILSFAKASTLNGAVVPTATLVSGGASAIQLTVDEKNDRLYAALGGTGVPRVWDAASTLTGNVAQASRTFNIVGNNNQGGIAIDVASDTLYISGRNTNSVYAIANGSTANGTVMPTRTITDATGLFQAENIGIYNDTLFVLSDSGPFHEVDKASTQMGTIMVSRTFKAGTISSLGGFAYAP